jgi:hypothetical protein
MAGKKRVYLRYPKNWDELTEEQKQEAAYEMALIIQRELRPPQSTQD